MDHSGQSKGKYQPWYHEAFMADRRVRVMSPLAVKTYMMLLHEAFVCSTRPNLPDDEEELRLLAYCNSPEEWDSIREVVLGMFSREVVDGQKVLTNKRLTKDWEHLQEIREARSEAGKASAAKRKATNVEQMLTNEHKEVSKEVSKEEKEVSETADFSLENDGQGEVMNLKTFKAEMTSVGVRKGVKVKGYDNTWDELKILAIAHGYQTVINDFEEFLTENYGNEFPKGFLQAYAWVAADRLVSDSPLQASAKDPEVVSLARELTYASKGLVAFQDKQRARLGEVLKEFSAAEILSVFAAWFADQDTSDPKNVSFLAGKFVQIADSLCYTARRQKQEAEEARILRDRTAARLQAEAEQERLVSAQQQKLMEDFDPLQ
jgi:uncharacterized protein YdaU (DUF1376 family)